jgi:hypothetical protein
MSAHIPRYAASASPSAFDEIAVVETVDLDVPSVLEWPVVVADESPDECESALHADRAKGMLATATHAIARRPR